MHFRFDNIETNKFECILLIRYLVLTVYALE